MRKSYTDPDFDRHGVCPEAGKIGVDRKKCGGFISPQSTDTAGWGEAEAYPFDLKDISDIPSLAKEIEHDFNRSVDILVNNAGMGVLGLVEEVPVEAFSHVLQINFLAPLALAQAVIPGMKSKRAGQIINISSGAGKRGLPLYAAYCASKFALNALTESIRVELALHGIDVIFLSPGLVDTPFSSRMPVYGSYQEQFSQGRKLSPEMTAEKVLYASEHRKRKIPFRYERNAGNT